MLSFITDEAAGGSLLGTNHKGYTLGGNLGLSPGVWVGLRWTAPAVRDDAGYAVDLV